MSVTQQNEVPITLESMRENRKKVLEIFNDIKGKFLKGYFTINDLVRDYKIHPELAKFNLDTLARNGLLNAQFGTTPQSTRYTLENNKHRQIENIRLWLNRSEQEMKFFSLAIAVVNEEIEASLNTQLDKEVNMKIIKDEI